MKRKQIEQRPLGVSSGRSHSAAPISYNAGESPMSTWLVPLHLGTAKPSTRHLFIRDVEQEPPRKGGKVHIMTKHIQRVLRAEFPGAEARYFAPMSIGSTPSAADGGAALILDGTKTATSSAYWDYADGRIPFVGALSVLLDGSGRARAILETERIEIMPFGAVHTDFARAYGEGDRTLDWFRSEIGAWY